MILILTLLAVLFTLVSFLLITINTGWGMNRLLGLINKNSDIRIELESLEINVFRGRAGFRGLQIFDADSVRMAGIDYFAAGIQYRPAFSKKYIVDSVIVAGIDIDISSEQISRFKSSESERKERQRSENRPDFNITKFQIRDISAAYKDIDKGAEYGILIDIIRSSADFNNMKFFLDVGITEASIKDSVFFRTFTSEGISLVFEEEDVFLDPARILTDGLDITLRGAVADVFEIPYLDINLSAEIDNSLLFSDHDVLSKDEGKFTISGSVQGTADDPVVNLSVNHPEGKVYAQDISSFTMRNMYKDKLLNIEARLDKSPEETFYIYGNIDLTSVFPQGLVSSVPVFENTAYDLRVIADNFSLKNIPGMPEVDFDFDLSLDGRGISADEIKAEIILNTDLSPFSFGAFELKQSAELFLILDWDKGRFGTELDLRTGKIKWDEYDISSLVVRGNADDSGMVVIDNLTARSEESEFRISGSSRLFGRDRKILKDPSFDAVLNAKRIDTSQFFPDIKTHLDLNAAVSGKVSDFSGSYEINADGFEYNGVITEGIKLNGRVEGKDIFVDHLGVKTGGSEIYLSGKITNYEKFDAVIRADGLIPGEIYPDIEDAAAFKTDISISAGGTFTEPDLEGNIRIRDIEYREFDISDINIEFGLKDMIAGIKIHYDFPININADLRQTTYEAELILNEWDYSEFIPGNTDRYFEGFLNGRIRAEGDYSDVQSYRITADLDSVVFSADKRKILHGSVLKASFFRGLLEAKEVEMSLLNDGFLSIKGMLDIEKDIEMSTSLSIPVRSLSFIIPELSGTEGYIDGKIELSGPLSAPVFEGNLNLKDIGIILPVTEQKLSGLNGKIGFKKSGITLEGISGRVERGTVGLNGSIRINGTDINNISAVFRASSLPVSYPDHLEGLINAEINYSGNLKKGRLGGNVLILDALYYRDYDLFGAFLGAGGPRIVRSESEKKDLPDISLDITLQSRRTIVMDNNLGFLELKPDLQIGGKLASPLISGRASIEKDGYLIFQKRSFVINRGVLDFEPVFGVMPIVDVESETRAGNHRVFLSISESLSNPRFSLTSFPPESDADILSILLFGRKTSELASGGDEVSREKMIADWLSGAYSDDIARRTGLDYIEFSVADDFSAREHMGFGLTVGRRISDRLMLKYSLTNTGTEMLQKGIADYQLFENIILSGFQSTDGTFGAETQFRVEFR